MPDPNQTAQTPPPPAIPEIPDLPPAPSEVQTTPPPPTLPGPALPPEIPPIIPSAPRKKFGGKKIITTILGLLVLIGGLGAGIILVKQSQEIREKAGIDEPCKVCSGGKCKKVASPPNCTISMNECSSDSECYEPPPPPPPPKDTCKDVPGQQCYSTPCSTLGFQNGTGECSSPTPYCCKTKCTLGEKCTTAQGCPGICEGTNQQNAFCSDIADNCPALCPADVRYCPDGNTVDRDPTNNCKFRLCPDKTDCNAFPERCSLKRCTLGDKCTTSAGCPGICEGTNQQNTFCSDIADYCGPPMCDFDAQDVDNVPPPNNCKGGLEGNPCINESGQSGSCKIVGQTNVYPRTCRCETGMPTSTPTSKPTSIPTSKPTSKPTSTPSPVAQCVEIKAYDTSWNLLTAAQLSALKAGDKVRFTVRGSATAGIFDKARFTINGTLRPEVTTKKPSTQEFYDEYTIPTGVTSFSIAAQVHHTTLGWK